MLRVGRSLCLGALAQPRGEQGGLQLLPTALVLPLLVERRWPLAVPGVRLVVPQSLGEDCSRPSAGCDWGRGAPSDRPGGARLGRRWEEVMLPWQGLSSPGRLFAHVILSTDSL